MSFLEAPKFSIQKDKNKGLKEAIANVYAD
jgi:hypothetical protein